MNDLVPLSDIEKMADIFGRNKLFGKTKEEMLQLMILAHAEGKHPAIAVQEYDMIQGRPAINSKAALSRFQASGGKIQWKERTDERATASFTHPSGGTLDITWDIKRATQAGLTGKDNWKKYPAQMLSARVIAEGVRAIYPACLSGMYTVEEVKDMAYIPPAPEPEMEVTIKAAEGQETVIESDDEKKARAKRIVEERGISDEIKAQAWKGAHGNWDDFIARLEAANAGPQPEIF